MEDKFVIDPAYKVINFKHVIGTDDDIELPLKN
jgi:hypothetical protein